VQDFMNAPFEGQGLNFVRPRAPRRIVAIEATPQPVELDLSATALVVVDMQNDFLHPDGWFAKKGVDGRAVKAVIPNVRHLVESIRAAGVPVIWLNWGVRADRANLPPMTVAKGRAFGSPTYADSSPSGRGGILVAGDWGARTIDELPMEPADILVHKHRLSGFWDNELDSLLRARGITTLMFAGINIDRCVFSTLQDANFLGYDCLLVEDACATVSPQFVTDAVLYLVRLLHGAVASSGAILSAIGMPDSSPPSNAPTPDRSAR
jgi:nicotinamidase-related amidase